MKKEIYKLRWGSTHDNVYYVEAETPLDAWRILIKRKGHGISAEVMQYHHPAFVISVIKE